MDALQGFISCEIDDIRKENRKHYERSFEAFFEKYSSIDPEHGGDVIDMKTLQIVEDHGYIKNMKPRPMSFASQYYIQRKEKLKLRHLAKKIRRFRKKDKKISAKVLNLVNGKAVKQQGAKQSEKRESSKTRKSNSFTTYDIEKVEDSSNSYKFPETSGLNENNTAKQSKKRDSIKPSRSNSLTTSVIANGLNSSNSSEFSITPGLTDSSPAKQSKKRKSFKPRRSNSFTPCDIAKVQDSSNTSEFSATPALIDISPAKQSKKRKSTKPKKSNSFTPCDLVKVCDPSNSFELSENSNMKENNKQFATSDCIPKSDETKKSIHRLDLNSIDKLFNYPQYKLDFTPVNQQKSPSIMKRSPLIVSKEIKMDDLISCGTPNFQHAASSEQVTDNFSLKKSAEQFTPKCDSPKLRRRKTSKPKSAAKGYTACNQKSRLNNREKLLISSPLKSSTPINRQRPFSFGVAKSPRMSLRGIKVDDLCNAKYTTLDQIAYFVKKNN